MISIYHSDPYPMFSLGLKKEMKKYPDIKWLGSQEGCLCLIENLKSNKADILITNNYVCDETVRTEMSEKLPEIRKALPDLKVVMLTMAESLQIQRVYKDKDLVEAFLMKDMETEEIYEVLKLVSNGGKWWYYSIQETKE